MSKLDQIQDLIETEPHQNQDFIETEPLNDLPLTAEQADKVRGGGEGKTVKIDFCKTDFTA